MSTTALVKETSRELVQSYILTSARRDWGIYAERFLLRLVEIAQSDVLGLDFKILAWEFSLPWLGDESALCYVLWILF